MLRATNSDNLTSSSTQWRAQRMIDTITYRDIKLDNESVLVVFIKNLLNRNILNPLGLTISTIESISEVDKNQDYDPETLFTKVDENEDGNISQDELALFYKESIKPSTGDLLLSIKNITIKVCDKTKFKLKMPKLISPEYVKQIPENAQVKLKRKGDHIFIELIIELPTWLSILKRPMQNLISMINKSHCIDCADIYVHRKYSDIKILPDWNGGFLATVTIELERENLWLTNLEAHLRKLTPESQVKEFVYSGRKSTHCVRQNVETKTYEKVTYSNTKRTIQACTPDEKKREEEKRKTDDTMLHVYEVTNLKSSDDKNTFLEFYSEGSDTIEIAELAEDIKNNIRAFKLDTAAERRSKK